MKSGSMRALLFFLIGQLFKLRAESPEGDQACVPQTVVLFVLAKRSKVYGARVEGESSGLILTEKHPLN